MPPCAPRRMEASQAVDRCRATLHIAVAVLGKRPPESELDSWRYRSTCKRSKLSLQPREMAALDSLQPNEEEGAQLDCEAATKAKAEDEASAHAKAQAKAAAEDKARAVFAKQQGIDLDVLLELEQHWQWRAGQ